MEQILRESRGMIIVTLVSKYYTYLLNLSLNKDAEIINSFLQKNAIYKYLSASLVFKHYLIIFALPALLSDLRHSSQDIQQLFSNILPHLPYDSILNMSFLTLVN